MIIQRRSFLAGLVSSLAAPAIVRVSSLMPVKVVDPVAILGWDVGHDDMLSVTWQSASGKYRSQFISYRMPADVLRYIDVKKALNRYAELLATA